MAHDWAAKVVTGDCELADVPSEFSEGVGLYAGHVHANGCPMPIVERRWESLSIAEFFGTIDCLLISDNRVAIYDYKNGSWPVRAANNSQLLCYASIVAEHFDINEFYGVIIQPNSWNKETTQVAEYSADQVAEHREKVAAAAVSNEKQTGSHCLWCPLLRTKKCNEGRGYATDAGWTTKYKHLGAKKK